MERVLRIVRVVVIGLAAFVLLSGGCLRVKADLDAGPVKIRIGR